MIPGVHETLPKAGLCLAANVIHLKLSLTLQATLNGYILHSKGCEVSTFIEIQMRAIP